MEKGKREKVNIIRKSFYMFRPIGPVRLVNKPDSSLKYVPTPSNNGGVAVCIAQVEGKDELQFGIAVCSPEDNWNNKLAKLYSERMIRMQNPKRKEWRGSITIETKEGCNTRELMIDAAKEVARKAWSSVLIEKSHMTNTEIPSNMWSIRYVPKRFERENY